MRKLLIVVGIIIGLPIFYLIVGVIFFLALIFFVIGPEEDFDNDVLRQTYGICKQLDEWKKNNGFYPAVLSEASISDQGSCFRSRCATFKYKVLDNKQNFTLAGKITNGMITFCGSSPTYNGSFGFAVSNGKSSSFPVYKKDKNIFATPSAWPDFE